MRVCLWREKSPRQRLDGLVVVCAAAGETQCNAANRAVRLLFGPISRQGFEMKQQTRDLTPSGVRLDGRAQLARRQTKKSWARARIYACDGRESWTGEGLAAEALPWK